MTKNNKERRIKHIITTLYKIKKINRYREYPIIELRKIVFDSKYGKQVIKELQEENITCQWLEDHNLNFARFVLSPKLKDN